MSNIVKILQQAVDLKKSMRSKLPDGWHFYGSEDFVLSLGKHCEAQKLPERYEMGPPKQCFQNSMLLAIEQDLIYVEGYALLKDFAFPIHHGWCVEPGSRKVIDVTSTVLDDYFGVAFNTRQVFPLWSNSESATLIDNWQDKWPLLRKSSEELREILYNGEKTDTRYRCVSTPSFVGKPHWR